MALTITYLQDLITSLKSSDSTKKTYLMRFEKIRKLLNKNTYSFLNDFDLVINTLEKTYTADSTLKSYFIALSAVLKNEKLVSETARDAYRTKMLEYRDKNNKSIRDNKPSIKESKNFMKFKDIQEMVENIYTKLMILSNNKKISETNLILFSNKRNKNQYLKLLSDYILLYYLSHTPPTRLEGYDVILLDKLPTKTNDTKNYIYVDTFNAVYYLNDFKNVKKIGKIKVRFEKELAALINDYYTFLKNNKLSVSGKYYLFTKFDGKGKPENFISANSFGQSITRLFKKYFDKKVTKNDLRHIYTTELMLQPGYNNLSMNEKEKLHSKLLHNKETGEEYFKLYELTSNMEYKKDISYDNKQEIEEILKKHGYNLLY